MTVTSSAFLEELEGYDALARRAALGYLRADGVSPYLGAPAAEYLERGGKGLRPALCLATCKRSGARWETPCPRRRPSSYCTPLFSSTTTSRTTASFGEANPRLHRRYGRALAINAGDGLAVLALGALRDNESRLGRRLATRIWSEFDFMARQTVDGQALELGWQREGRTDLTPDDYLDMIMKKTCWYTTLLPLRVGALIGARGAVDLEPMLRFGFFLGAAFQIRDDILNLTGSPAVYGKEPLGDLREGKRTLMLAHLLAAADPQDRDRVVQYLGLQPAERSAA